MKKNNVVNFGEAENNARIRDFKNESEKFKHAYHGVDQEEINKAMETLSKATGGKEIYIGGPTNEKRKTYAKEFVQIILSLLNTLSVKDL